MVEKEIPYCAIFLVVAAFVSNVLVLVGNLEAAAAFDKIAESSGGWSDVGTSMAKAFNDELDERMNDVTLRLTKTVSEINEIQSSVDNMVALIGSKTDKSLLQLASNTASVVVRPDADFDGNVVKLKEDARKQIKAHIHEEVEKTDKMFKTFLKAITPALLQIGDWQVSFGSKLQEHINQFGTTVDWVQKAFDQIMAKLRGEDPSWEDYMIYNTFTLFDPQDIDCITQGGLTGAAQMYHITAVAGAKGEEAFDKYSGDDDCIDHNEYIDMAGDPGLNGFLATALRTYAKGLSRVSGTMGRARLRSKVAESVVDYLNFVSVRNHTKVGWIADRLTNSSVPMAFTACILRQLAVQTSDANFFSTIDVGQLVVEFLLFQNITYTKEAFDLVSKPSFWSEEGFLDTGLPEVVEIVGEWMRTGINTTKNGSNPARRVYEDAGEHSDSSENVSLLQEGSTLDQMEILFKSDYVKQLQVDALADIKKEKEQRHLELIQRTESLREAHTSRHLFRELLGGRTMGTGKLTPAEWEALHSGEPAVPETLEFAKFLSYNATRDSAELLNATFKYSGSSSNQLDAFASEVKSFVGKTASFLSTIASYSGQSGIDFLKSEIDNFVEGAEATLFKVIEPKIDSVVESVVQAAAKIGKTVDADTISKAVEEKFEDLMAEKAQAAVQKVGENAGDEDNVSAVVFEEINTLLQDLMALLPSAAKTVSQARSEVIQVAEVMKSIFGTFGVLGPQIFNQISMHYSILWTVYFILLLPLTLGTLWYAMWASGWMGGPSASDWPEESEEDAAKPKTVTERVTVCYNACCIACSRYHDTMMCFWSCLIIYQVIVLVMFLVCILICLLNGVKAFFNSSCNQIYMLNQADMCTNVLTSVRDFITTFTVDPKIPIEATCNDRSLLTCDLIGKKMVTSTLYTTIFSLCSAILQYQLVVESSILHERTRMRRIVEHMKAA